MSITSEEELVGISRVGEAVGSTLRAMREFVQPGMNAREVDEYGRSILESFGARSAPKEAYKFPGWTCISVNQEIAHGIPSKKKVFKQGDLINIDVSAELDGFWADNGGSFILGEDMYRRGHLVDTSKKILQRAIATVRPGMKIAELGKFIYNEAKKAGFSVIKNLTGHGVGRKLHEEPLEIECYYNRANRRTFRRNSVVAIETFISTKAEFAHTASDGWTLYAKDGSLVAQHEHTILITDEKPIILTKSNNLW